MLTSIINDVSNGILDPLKATEIIKQNPALHSSVNAVDAQGSSLMHFASRGADVPTIQSLINCGAVFSQDNLSVTPLMEAVKHNNIPLIQYYLSICTEDELLMKNVNELSVLHLAALNPDPQALSLLLNDPRIKKIEQDKNFYGKTARDLAIEEKNNAAIRMLSDDPTLVVEDLPNYGKSPPDISQLNINNKLKQFLTLYPSDRNINELLSELGNCNGWAFLNQIYASKGKEDDFYDILEVFAHWDGTEEDLMNGPLPASLKERYANKKILFDEFFNTLNIFQYTSDAAKELHLIGVNQRSRLEQYELVKDQATARELRHLFSYTDMNLNKAQLTEMLAHLSQWRGVSIDIGGAKHATSVYITPEGKFRYYDPDHYQRTPLFDSAESLADHLFKGLHKVRGKVQDNKINITFDAYKFYPQQEKIPTVETPVQQLSRNSPNQFSSLQYAIMNNDIKKIKEELEAYPDLMQKDLHGSTPLGTAIRYKNLAGIQLIKEAMLERSEDISSIATELDFSDFESAPEYIELLIERGILQFTSKDKHGKSFLHSPIGYKSEKIRNALINDEQWDPNALDDSNLSPIIYAIKYGDEEMVTQIKNKNNFNINAVDSTSFTPFLYAVYEGSDENTLRTLLSCKGIDINHKSRMGNTALSVSIINYRPRALRLLIAREDLDPNVFFQDEPILIAAIRQTPLNGAAVLLLNNTKIDPNVMDEGITPLQLAIEEEKNDVLQALLKRNDLIISETNKTALRNYAMGRPEILLLLQTRAEFKDDIHLANDIAIAKLMKAVYENNKETIQTLLKDEIDANQLHFGQTPLLTAIDEELNEASLSLLADPRVDPNIPGEEIEENKPPRTPLLTAINNNSDEIVMALLGRKDLKISDYEKQVLIDYAQNKADIKTLIAAREKTPSALQEQTKRSAPLSFSHEHLKEKSKSIPTPTVEPPTIKPKKLKD